MPTDIEIAQAAKMLPITEIAKSINIPDDALILYGRYKAKVDPRALGGAERRAKLVLVTAINPTPAGEGKTTVSVGLADGLNLIGAKAMLALREPSLGPVFGVKGGAAGGGYSQVVPMEDINLHFTGDLHAITAANNLLAAMIDNHIFQGNALGIDPRRVVWRRCMDMNDRQLRNILDGMGGRTNGMPREDGFDITAASEVMATLCLARDISDLKERLGRLLIGWTFDKRPVYARDIKAQGAMTALLKDAMMPNLVQTLAHTPALIHGGPFANIAHGCNSYIATDTAMRLSDYTVTEAGFGADLGAEKFIDIKCRLTGLRPDCVVIVATVRALKSHGGVKKPDLSKENLDALRAGLPNLMKHIDNVTKVWGLNAVVAINRFASDTEAEIELVRTECAAHGACAIPCDVWGKGGAGATELAAHVKEMCDSPKPLTFTYDDETPLDKKIAAVAKKVYGAAEVKFAPGVRTKLKQFAEMGYGNAPVCIAKTQYSLSDDMSKLGAPEGFTLNVRDARLSAGAGFVVAFTGEIIAMPGLPKVPAAENIDVDENGVISGLF